MDAQSLLASAAINIGLALVLVCLFSIMKKQPSNASIYYARRVSLRHHIPFDHSFTFHRFTPSVSWISRALRFTEDEILEISGLDGLILIRLFKFGSHSMDSFTISNIGSGSDRSFGCTFHAYGLYLVMDCTFYIR
ncbi:unnamed protein product [Camellia sinensis]